MKTILVVESFQTARKAIVNALTRNGYNALEADGGIEALQLFNGRMIDLLVTDLKLSSMSGVELVAAIRRKTQYKYMPVLILAGKPQNENSYEDCSLNVSWVKKPFELEGFIKLVGRSMNNVERHV